MVSFFSLNIPVTSLLIMIAILILVILALLIFLIISHKKTKEMTYPVYDYIVKEAQKKAQEITWDALKSSRDIIKDAELQGMKTISKEKSESEKIEQEYEIKLNELSNHTKELLNKYAKEAETNFLELTKSLEKTIGDNIKKNDSYMQSEIEKLSKNLTSVFSTLEANVKEQMRGSVEKEFITVKEIIESYRQKRFALVDNQIVSLIEKVAGITLQKKLSLSDHSELIYKALEEAKSKDVFLK